MLFITTTEALEQTAAAMRQRRIGQQLTQEVLAHKSGVKLATLRKFERTGLVSLESFYKLAIVLGVLEKIVSSVEEEDRPNSFDALIKKNKKQKRMRVRTGHKS